MPWPAAGQACSGYLVEHEGFRLVLDPGYATLPQLLMDTAAEQVDAVLTSHDHPDHCADLNPLLRARALGEAPPPALPVHTLPGAMDAVLALDNPRMLADAYLLREFTAGHRFEVGPFHRLLRRRPACLRREPRHRHAGYDHRSGLTLRPRARGLLV